MKDNTVNVNGIEVYTHDINYYADEYIKTELDINCVDDSNRQSVSDSFVDMIFYIADRIKKPSNDNIELLDDIFNIYIRLCTKYRVLPTLEVFSFLVGINRSTFSDWSRGDYRIGSAHGTTVKKWFDICKSFTVNKLHNTRGTDANLIFIAKSAYGMAEAAPMPAEKMEHVPQISMDELSRLRAERRELPQKPEFD